MIARFQFLLPFDIYIPVVGGPATAWQTEKDGRTVRIAVAQAVARREEVALFSTTPLKDAMRRVRASTAPEGSDALTYDGHPTFPANLVIIDFLGSDFDRSPGVEDPPKGAALDVVKDALARLRFVLQAPYIRLLAGELLCRCDYLDDSGGDLPGDPALRRSRVWTSYKVNLAALPATHWLAAAALPDEIPVWESLLLDARAVSGSAEASVILASTALESFIDHTLETAAAMDGKISPSLYAWIANRDQFPQQPSFADQYDVLLREVVGASLKTGEPNLWASFQDIKNARNSAVHEGRAQIGNQAVGEEKAVELVGRAEQIIRWVEALLPPDRRRVEFPVPGAMKVSKDIGPEV